jgi:predicted nucleic acid-binding protein
VTLVDTDVLIWNLRGNEKAARALDAMPGFFVSAITYMELVQGVRDKRELRVLRQALSHWGTRIVQIDEGVSARACFLTEQHHLSHSLQLADALIAATALEHGVEILTGNAKHYRAIEGLAVRTFRP